MRSSRRIRQGRQSRSIGNNEINELAGASSSAFRSQATIAHSTRIVRAARSGGSAVTGKVAGRAPGATAKDIPLLKLEAERGNGQLTVATTIQRINTKRGAADGPCENSGAYLSVPYSADYTFLTKGG